MNFNNKFSNNQVNVKDIIKKEERKVNFLPQFVCSWLKDENIRESLIKRIKYKKEQKLYGQNKVVNDQSLAEQYFQVWMEQPHDKPLTKLVMHPLLTVQDQKAIDDYSLFQRNDQIKFSAQLTSGAIALYWVFFSRMAVFQRFFNNRNKHFVFNGLKKFLGLYCVFIVCQASMTSHYEKKIPQSLNEKGYFKKYGIQFEQKNV